jgi:hypothetical protein
MTMIATSSSMPLRRPIAFSLIRRRLSLIFTAIIARPLMPD